MATQRAKQKAREAARVAARELRGELYRKIVIEAAQRVFARKGYDDAKMGEIAEESGLSLQTLYSVFPGKAGLFHAVQENGDRELHDRVTQSALGIDDPLAALVAGLRATTAYFLEHPDFLRMRLQGGQTWGTEPSAAGDRGRSASWRAALEKLRAACQRCIQDGLFVDRDPELIARMIVSMQQVELAHWLERGGRDDVERVTGELEEQVMRAFRALSARAETNPSARARASRAAASR